MTYFNTTDQKGKALKEYQDKAKSQDEIVLEIFKNESPTILTPGYVHQKSQLNCPLTSIRRSMTNLTKQGKLVKTDHKAGGMYGREEYCWKLAPAETIQTELKL